MPPPSPRCVRAPRRQRPQPAGCATPWCGRWRGGWRRRERTMPERARLIGETLLRVDRGGSTNDLLRSLAQHGAHEGNVALAREQTGGGRRDGPHLGLTAGRVVAVDPAAAGRSGGSPRGPGRGGGGRGSAAPGQRGWGGTGGAEWSWV